jgi:nitroimidazol reductase NimA-like FMN-containing flavoprotein (pyridoxamine 5'-phosphate oxidase superfamily)
MNPPPRPAEQRKQDTLHRLEHDVDAWIATADPATGTPYLVPLSFVWDGETLLIATPRTNPTGRNLRTRDLVRVGLGPTRDVVLVEGTARPVEPADLTVEEGDLFAARTGFDPRRLRGFLYFRVRPLLIQAWREANEIKGRDLMVDGAWLV